MHGDLKGRSSWSSDLHPYLCLPTTLSTFSNVQSEHYQDRKSTRLNSSHSQISYAVFCLKKKKKFSLMQLLLVTLIKVYSRLPTQEIVMVLYSSVVLHMSSSSSCTSIPMACSCSHTITLY